MFTKLISDLQELLDKILKAFSIDKYTDVQKDQEHYRLNIKIGSKISYISINGKGVDKKKYYEELLDIIQKEVNSLR